jgi:hypothetical protein
VYAISMVVILTAVGKRLRSLERESSPPRTTPPDSRVPA